MNNYNKKQNAIFVQKFEKPDSSIFSFTQIDLSDKKTKDIIKKLEEKRNKNNE